MNENLFIRAVERNELSKFLLGQDEYFIHGDEWSGGYERHDSGNSFTHIKSCILCKEMEEQAVYKILDAAMVNVMKSNCTASVMFEMSMCLWRYFVTAERCVFNERWTFSAELLELLRKGYALYLDEQCIQDEELRHLMIAHRRLFKERFGLVL